MPVTVKGSGGGSVTLDASTAAADTTLTMPNVSGTILQSGTAVTAAQGGTGLTSPGTNGNVLTSNGTIWTSTAPATTGVNVQSFTGSGTWTKPAYAAGSRVLIQAWGGGGSGGRGSQVGGGGGGGYNERWITLSAMGATETVTIGAGGTAITASNTKGNDGGNTSVGSLITAYGGGGGGSPTYNLGGGGGGQLSAGLSGERSTPPYGGAPYGLWLSTQTCGAPYWLGPGGGGGWVNRATGQNGTAIQGGGLDGFMHGGGGGNSGWTGGNSVWGGGGGGGDNNTGTIAGGTSSFGGNGGAGGSSGNGTAGTQPSGGGGGTRTGTSSGAGGAGQVIITVFPA